MVWESRESYNADDANHGFHDMDGEGNLGMYHSVRHGHILLYPETDTWLCRQCGAPRKGADGLLVAPDKGLHVLLTCGHSASYLKDACAPVVERMIA